jgi:ankyrin repeat protein
LLANPLVEAVKHNDMAAVRALLQQRADVNAPDGDGATALHWAVYRDDAQLVDLLIAAGANVNAANDLAITPLYLASVNGNAAIVKRLLDKKANPNAASETGVTPLMESARSGSVDVVRALLAHGAEVNVKERDRGQTALMWAVARHHPDVVKILIERGADVHARTRVRNLTVMLDQGPRRAVKTARQDAKQIAAGASTPLLFAAQTGDAESAGHLLAAGADPNVTAADGNSALVSAIFSGNPAVARVLLEAGANPDAAGGGYTPLHVAMLRGDSASAKALLAKGANPNVLMTKGSPVRRFGSQWALPTPLVGATPLFVAATFLEVELIRLLLAAGANPALGLPNGTTPLLAAAGIAIEKETRPSDLVRWNVVDSDQPVIPREERDVLAAVELLLSGGADVNGANAAGDTALHAAAGAGMTTVIERLAEAGAKLDVKNNAGQTPLALTLPRRAQSEGRSPAAPGFKAAEELLRKLGATQ